VDMHRCSRATGAGDPISYSLGPKPSQSPLDDARNVQWLEEPVPVARTTAEVTSLCLESRTTKMMSLAAMQQKRHHVEHEARN
jgi:hypothetical protein